MKKRIAFLLTFIMVLGIFSVSAFAGSNDSVLTGAVFSVLADYTEADIGTYQMRGFTASADGKYLYGGLLQGNRRVVRFDINTGAVAGEWQDTDLEYPKGLASDDRGYTYVGLTGPNGKDTFGHIVILDKDLLEVARIQITNDAVFGINGVSVEKINEKYYLYFVMNYGPNAIYSYDVTDISALKLNDAFGEGGKCDFVKLSGSEGEASYLDIDTDGSIYVSANVNAGGSKGDSLLHIAADGKSIITTTPVVEAYGVALFEEYVLVSTYNKENSCVEVVDKATMKSIGQIGKFEGCGNYNGVAVVNDVIYIDDAGREGNADRILKTGTLGIVRPEPVVETPVEEVAEDVSENPVTNDNMSILFITLSLLSISAITLITKKSKSK
ncbi:MAG: hypothetical protein K0S55_587 [Clostridia bacterium]|jgi:hypothetical protein|nr:hypothetical protein [Clostridia bacterium]